MKMLLNPPTFFAILGFLALLGSCKAESYGNALHRAHRHAPLRPQQGSAGERRRGLVPRHDDVVVVTETVYETTYLGYIDTTTQTTTTLTIFKTAQTSSATSSDTTVTVHKTVTEGEQEKASPAASTSQKKTEKLVKTSTTSKMIIPTRSIVTSAAAISTTLRTSIRSSTSSPAAVLPSAVSPSNNAAYSAVAKAAITALQPFYNTANYHWTNVGGWIAANAYNDIMDFDLYTKSTTYESSYGAALLTIATSTDAQGQVLSTDGFNDDQLWWCLAMLRAYQNYGHKELLTQSIKQWRAIGANAQVFKSDQGTTPNKAGLARNIPIAATCDVDGAVYWSSQPDSSLNAISTGLYAQVGAWLLQLTGDNTFRAATDSALGWLERMMLNADTGIMNIDSYTMNGCEKHFGSLTYNTGVYIGALSRMYLVTGEQSYLTQALQSVESSVTGSFGNDDTAPLVIVQQEDLIDNRDDVQWRDVLFRNLIDFYVNVGAKGVVSSDLKTKMAAFFKANYDQIQSKAKFGNLYAPNWFGKMNTGSDFGTVSVLSCLTGAMILL